MTAYSQIEPLDLRRHKHIEPACLPEGAVPEHEDTLAVVAGWGLAGSGLSSTVSHTLQTVMVTLMTQADCTHIFHSSVTRDMVCIRGRGESIGSTCPGDSGGGVFYKNGDRYEVVGIVSWDRGTVGCQDYMPTVATRVTSVLAWVRMETRESHFCN